MPDRNFDDLQDRFNKNIYQSDKGKIRLAMLESDVHELVPFLGQDHKFTMLDAGELQTPRQALESQYSRNPLRRLASSSPMTSSMSRTGGEPWMPLRYSA